MQKATSIEILNYVKALALHKRAQAVEEQLGGNNEEAEQLKKQEDILWVIHRNSLIGNLPDLTEKIKKQTEELS